MTILSVTAVVPLSQPAAAHPELRADPPPRAEERRVAQVGTNLVAFTGGAVPTQTEVDAFLAARDAADAEEAQRNANVAEAEAQRVTMKGEATLRALIRQTRAEWDAWAQTNFPTLTTAERTRMGTMLWLLSVVLRRLIA